jgi:hypothetical protein
MSKAPAKEASRASWCSRTACACAAIERQHALAFQPRQFGAEDRDLVGALLRLAA